MGDIQKAKPVKAFVVSNGDPECDTIQFATTNVAARRKGASEIDDDFGSVSCRRLRWADEFAGKWIPAKAYIDNGWRVSCTGCGDYVSEDAYRTNDDGEDVPLDPVYRDTHVFCCPNCEATHDAAVAEQDAKFAAFERRAREARPDLEYKSFRGAYPYITMTGEFTFAGAKYGGSVRDEGDGELKWFIANGDKDAWDAREAELVKAGDL